MKEFEDHTKRPPYEGGAGGFFTKKCLKSHSKGMLIFKSLSKYTFSINHFCQFSLLLYSSFFHETSIVITISILTTNCNLWLLITFSYIFLIFSFRFMHILNI
jgi:hypothetical protein